VPCFCRGTRIAAERGEIPVQALAVGDRVRTLSGAVKPIIWIGIGRDLVTRANKLARPVIVQRGALADNVPIRDLYLTHGHALFFDGALIAVEHLINHRTILWDERAQVVEYYHIELEDHDVVLADGAPTETYYDNGNRVLFQNTRERSVAGKPKPTFAPVLTTGEIVGEVWARLCGRADACYCGDTTEDPDLHLIVDGRHLRAASATGGLYVFEIGAVQAGAHLRSRTTVPSLVGLSRHEHRTLGVAVSQLILEASGTMTCFDHDASLFQEGGCHRPEKDLTWTDGNLELPAGIFAHLRGPAKLIVQTVKQGLRYPIEISPAAPVILKKPRSKQSKTNRHRAA
jgi:hypothetical protein